MDVQSKLLSKLSFDPGILVYLSLGLSIVALIIIIILYIRQNTHFKKYRSFMRGRGGKKS